MIQAKNTDVRLLFLHDTCLRDGGPGGRDPRRIGTTESLLHSPSAPNYLLSPAALLDQ